MLAYIIRRILIMVPLLIFVTAFVFLLGQYGAADMAMEMTLRINDNVFDAELYAAIQKNLGLDQPIWTRYTKFILNALRGDFGVSYALPGTPDIARMIITTLPISLQLGLAALFLLTIVGIPLGVFAAVYRNRFLDFFIVTGTTTISSIPPFVLAPIALVVLVSQLKILPTTGFGWHGLFSRETLLPAAVLAAGPLLGVVRFTRAAVIDVLAQDYVRAARARGLNESMVVSKHVVKNAMTPVLTVLGLTTGRLLSGSIFIETVFGINGFGDVAVSAFQSGDIQTVAATTLVSGAIVVVMNLVVDVLYGVLDPRVRVNV
ncbi:MAG: ABC transporter permease [Chloroflexota bacterium]